LGGRGRPRKFDPSDHRYRRNRKRARGTGAKGASTDDPRVKKKKRKVAEHGEEGAKT